MTIPASELRILLDLLPVLEGVVAEAIETVRDGKEQLPHSLIFGPSWAHLYDLPFREHMAKAASVLGLGDALVAIARSELPMSAMRDIAESAEDIEIDTDGMSKDEIAAAAWAYLSLSMSMYYSMRALLTFGRYINELLATSRQDKDDKALLDAIRIDATVVGSRTATVRMSRATLEGDSAFLRAVRRAMAGKLTKRQNANFQKMRLIVRVLADSKAGRLSDEDLHRLFTEELRLYPSFSKDGDVVKNLRKFVDGQMRLATTDK